MIKDIFIPEKIGSYYLLAKRIIGLDIGTTQINVTTILMNGSQATIEQCTQYPLNLESPMDYHERVQATLKTIAEQLPKYNELRSSISSSSVIFKKIKLPFVEREKIHLVIYYEIEPLLPFAIDDAIVDFIITSTDQTESTAEVLVAAVRKRELQDHLALFNNTGIQPDIVGIDVFSLYSLYLQMNTVRSHYESVALINLGTHETSIIYIYKDKLQSVRVLPKGTSDIAKKVATTLKIPLQEVIEYMVRFGMKGDYTNSNLVSELPTALQQFWSEIMFTLHSFKNIVAEAKSIDHLFILGSGSQMQGLSDFVTHTTHISCTPLPLDALFTQKMLLSKKTTSLAQICILSMSIALSHEMTDDVNLRQKEFALSNIATTRKKVIVAGVFSLMIITLLVGNNMWQRRKINNEIYQSEQEVISILRDKFPQLPPDENSIEDVIDNAQKKLIEEEKVWFAFSTSARASVLSYLLELFTKLDKESLDLQVEQIIIQSHLLTLKARVRDHQALKLLERDLRKSPFFEYVEGQEDPSFTMKIRLANTHKESS